MTSEAGRNRREPRGAAGPGAACRPARLRGGGFTLFEMMLAIGLIVLLTGLTVLNFTGWLASSHLPESALAYETVLRMARADAANMGRRLRIEFPDPDSAPLILWEAQPLEQPGTFTEYLACTWKHNIPTEAVRVVRCQRTDLDEQADETQEEQPALQPITFNPDGSSDSAVIELRPTSGSDSRCAIIELDGLNGTVATRLVEAEDTESSY